MTRPLTFFFPQPSLPFLAQARPHATTKMASLMKPTPVTQKATRTVSVGLIGLVRRHARGDEWSNTQTRGCFFFFRSAPARAPALALFSRHPTPRARPRPPPRPAQSTPLWLVQRLGDLMGEARKRTRLPHPAREEGRGSRLDPPKRGVLLSSSGVAPPPASPRTESHDVVGADAAPHTGSVCVPFNGGQARLRARARVRKREPDPQSLNPRRGLILFFIHSSSSPHSPASSRTRPPAPSGSPAPPRPPTWMAGKKEGMGKRFK